MVIKINKYNNKKLKTSTYMILAMMMVHLIQLRPNWYLILLIIRIIIILIIIIVIIIIILIHNKNRYFGEC